MTNPLLHNPLLPKSDLEKRRTDANENRPNKKIRQEDPTDSDENDTVAHSSTKRHKHALIFGYIGTGYRGMQRLGPETESETIEGVLEQALFKCGGIHEKDLGCSHREGWTRVARTDKGVHAACQVVGVRLDLTKCDASSHHGVDKASRFLSALAATLPECFRCFALLRVTKQFDARRWCSKRQYEYLLPSWLLKDIDAKQDSTSSADVPNEDESENRPPSPPQNAPFPEDLRNFSLPDEKLAKFESVLSEFVGSHNFHNFTSRKSPRDPTCYRYMERISVRRWIGSPMVTTSEGESVTIGGGDFLIVTMKGQSFLLNQIRKMIALAIEVVRGAAPADAVSECLKTRERRFIHLAPAEGLFLDRVFFDSYNESRANPPLTPHIPLGLDEDWVMSKMVAFKEELLYPKIIGTIFQQSNNAWMRWFEDINNNPYIKSHTTVAVVEGDDGNNNSSSSSTAVYSKGDFEGKQQSATDESALVPEEATRDN